MRPILLLAAFMVHSPASADCRARAAEPFDQFIASFGHDKHFALKRTEYPVTVVKHLDVDGNREGRVAIKTLIEKNDDAAVPAIAVFARDNDAALSTVSLHNNAATVRMAKPGTDALLLHYHFVRKGACWYLRRIEDHSL